MFNGFYQGLLDMFGKDAVLIAPVKDLRRCKAKLDDYKKSGAPAPYAANICDFLRATILCSTFDEMPSKIASLKQRFPITRVKSRITPDLAGNKVVLVNCIIKDESIQPIEYPWSGWWKNQHVQMIGEVSVQFIYSLHSSCVFNVLPSYLT